MRFRTLIAAAVMTGAVATGAGVAAADSPSDTTRPTATERCARYAEHADEIAERIAALEAKLAELNEALAEHPDQAERINKAIANVQRRLDRLNKIVDWANENCTTVPDPV